MTLIRSSVFHNWVTALKDNQTRAKILRAVKRLGEGNPGDSTPVGESVSELRLHFGPGWRVYYFGHGEDLIVLLAGGNKSTQSKDIVEAKLVAREFVQSRKKAEAKALKEKKNEL
jgi:putative addiction module killer protein